MGVEGARLGVGHVFSMADATDSSMAAASYSPAAAPSAGASVTSAVGVALAVGVADGVAVGVALVVAVGVSLDVGVAGLVLVAVAVTVAVGVADALRFATWPTVVPLEPLRLCPLADSQPVITTSATANVARAVASMPPATAQGLRQTERLTAADRLVAGTAVVCTELSLAPSSGTTSTSVSPEASRSTIFLTPSRVRSRPLVYKVLAMAATTLATAAPIRVPATPNCEPTTAVVTAAIAPPPIWGRLNSFAFAAVSVVVVSALSAAVFLVRVLVSVTSHSNMLAGFPTSRSRVVKVTNNPNPSVSQPESFFDKVGGHDTFVALVDRFYAGVANDPPLRDLYPEADLGPANVRLRMFLEQYFGGPKTYSEQRGHPRLRLRHGPYAVTPTQRDRWLHHMLAALDSLQLPADDDAEMRDYLTRAAHFMVNSLDE